LLPLIARSPHRIPGCLGASQRNCPEDEKDQGNEQQDSEYIEQYMEQPEEQTNA
jgi:hypothetical protein